MFAKEILYIHSRVDMKPLHGFISTLEWGSFSFNGLQF